MKKLFALLPVSIFFLNGSAQNPDSSFKIYQQNIPGSSLSFKMLPIQSGHFLMGSPATEKPRDWDEGPQIATHLSAFWMGAYEVTRDELDIFLKDETTSLNAEMDAVTRPSPQYIDFSGGMGKEGGYPANSMSQYGAMMYCRWLYQKTGIFYRLPTEAEWEYACRAGSHTPYFFGTDSTQLGKYAWYHKNSEDKFHKVGQKLPNPWGLYDIVGNMLEWTLDHYEPYQQTFVPRKDPMANPNPLRYPKALRGGGFTEKAATLRSAKRFNSDPEWNRRDPQIPKSKWWLTEAISVGFRLVRPLQQPEAKEVNDFFNKYLGL